MLNYLERLQRITHLARGTLAAPHHERPHYRALHFEILDARIMLDASGNAIATLSVAGHQQLVPAALVNTAAGQSTNSSTAPIAVSAGGTLNVQVAANGLNVPANQVVYSLDPGAPQGAQINAQSGLLTWNVPTNFATGPVTLTVRATELNGPRLSVTEPLVVNVTGFNGFDLFTAAAVELGGFASGLAIDTGVNINGNLSVAPFGAGQPGALPAQVAALQQLAGQIPATTGLADLGLAGRLPAGIVDMVLGFDSGIPHTVDAIEIQLGRYGGSSGGGMSDQGVSPQKGGMQKAGAMETFDDTSDPRNDSGQNKRATDAPVFDTTRSAPDVGPRPGSWTGERAQVEAGYPAQAHRGRPPAPLLAAASRVTEEDVAKAMAAQRDAAAAAMVMPILIAQLPQRHRTHKRPRLGRFLEPLGR
jgi:hypothetical protein